MTCISEWSVSLSYTRLSAGLQLLEPPPITPRRFNLLSFLAAAQALDITLLPITWEAARRDVGVGGTSRINQSLANLHTSFAFKRIHDASKRQKTEREIFHNLTNEIRILSHKIVREHQSIAQLQGICWDISPKDGKPWPVLVFEKSQFGDLYRFASLPVGREMSMSDSIGLCVDIGRAVVNMHASNIIHGDIKPENVLIFKELGRYSAKVTDFGYSAQYTNDDCWLRLPRSWPWNAPEHDRPARDWRPWQAVKADIFSFGMLCFWLLFEPSLSKGTAPPQGLHSATAERPSLAKDTLCEIKGKLQLHAQQFIKAEVALDGNRREALGEFFDATLNSDPQKRETNLENLLRKLDPEQEICTKDSGVETNYLSCATDFEIQNSIHDFYYCDYRVRFYIAELLLTEYQYEPSLALQLAFCYYIGFGLPCNEDKVSEILEQNKLDIRHIQEIMSQCIQIRHEYQPATLGRLWDSGHIKRTDYRYTYLDQVKLEEAEEQLLQETKSLKNRFGKEHELVQISLIMVTGIYSVRGQWSEVER
ncbi:kinase-like domain-containing protein [Nemania abortiva]|nr:kinase-like domain-containing protein [Nemania abortiva]